ncbi:MAG: 50S ribosomal protein L22 [Armatimonadota bacterium]|nr:50S ribosomal protein L22 [Armatimonadota bacterium]
MQVKAQVKYLRRGPRKVRRYAELIVGKDLDEARAILAVQRSPVCREIEKVLESAVANAENNFGLDPDDLWVEKAYVDKALTIPRIKPRARGRADRIQKRTCHVTIVLDDGEDEESQQ